MPLYLAPYIGSGIRADPFRPRGSDQEGWRAIRLKNTDLSLHQALLWLPIHDPDILLDRLADDPQENLTLATRTKFLSRLLVSGLQSTRFDQAVLEMLLAPPTNTWNVLRPSKARNRYEVTLGPLFVSQPILQGGVSIADTFNRANGNLDGSTSSDGQFTWSEFVGTGWSVDTNAALVADDGADNYARAQLDMATDDHWAQATITAFTQTDTAGNSIDVGTIVRKSSTATFTCYYGNAERVDNGATMQYRLTEITAGSFATLGTNAQDPAVNDVIRTEADGSTIRVLVNSIELISVTDTSITGNLRAGIGGFSSTANNEGRLDSFSAQDVVVAAALDHGEFSPRAFLVEPLVSVWG